MKSHPASKTWEKVAWLLSHQKEWEGIGSFDFNEPRFGVIAKMMIAEGLYSNKTYFLDVQVGVSKHIEMAKKHQREGEKCVCPLCKMLASRICDE